MLKRASAWWRDARRTTRAAPREEPAFAADLAAGGRTAAAWVDERLASQRLYGPSGTDAIEKLRIARRAEVDRTIAAADRLLRHEFDLLGSGPYLPVDPDRPVRDGYVPIDWYLDPVRHLRFPRGVPHKNWKLYEMRPANADVKYPWELARCQHWATIGQAFQLSGDERFAREIARELDDFVEANPLGVGINWTCTMDVGLRAVSWAIGLEMVRESAELDAVFWVRAYSALHDHGIFIAGNLENTYEVNSNHFLSDVVGLWFLGSVFADLRHGREWSAFARESLEREIDVQVLADGADFESSVPYHRFVTELFLGSLCLADARGEPFSGHYRSRVRGMVDYLALVQRPDGLMPQIGDADDGRLHVFGAGVAWSPQDARHLFGPAAAIFDHSQWAALGGDAGRWEAAWWGLDVPTPARAVDRVSRLSAEAGVAVMNSGPHCVFVTNAIVGTKGFGNHKHNDQLSFEFHPDGVPLIVDAGSYVYTSDQAARNRFRGTRYHNTLSIDAVEQNEMNPEWLFRLFESARAEHVSFEERSDSIEYAGRHHGYERLADPVTHERLVTLTKRSGALRIVDRLYGHGEHELLWHFHLAPGVTAAVRDDRTVELSRDRRRWNLSHPEGLRVAIVAAEYSPSYGVAVPCLAIDLAVHAVIDARPGWQFQISE